MALTGAAVSAVLGELLKCVLEIKGKIEEYNSVLKRIETTLQQIEPIVKEIDDLKGKPDPEGRQTEHLWGEIQRGKDLIRCCKNEIGGCCSCFQKPQYQYLGRLQELDKSLSSFYSILVSLHTLRVSIQTREIAEDARKKVGQTREIVEDVREKVGQTREIAEDVRDKVGRNQATTESINESMLGLHRKIDEVGQHVRDLGKILAKNSTNDSAVDASNKSQRQGSSHARPPGYVSGDETRSTSTSAPTRVPERSVSSVPHDRKPVLGEYERANSKGKYAAATPAFPTKATGLAAAAPKEYTPPSPVHQTSGFGQVKPNLEEDRHQDQTRTATLMAHNVPPSHPSSPHKSSEVVKDTRRDGPAQILPYQAMDSPWQHPHVQPASRKFKQVPEKTKEMPTEPAYSNQDSPARSLTYQTVDPPWQQPHVQPEPRKFKQVPDKVTEVPNKPAYITAISPLASNDWTRGASSGKDSPSGRHSSYPVKPVGPATANYGFGIPPKSPETKSISPAQDRYRRVAPTTTTAANPSPHHPYIPTNSQEMITTYFAKALSSRDDSLTPSYIPHSSQPRTKEAEYDKGNLVRDKWKSGQSNPEIKKVCGEEWRRHKSRDQKEYWSSDENEE